MTSAVPVRNDLAPGKPSRPSRSPSRSWRTEAPAIVLFDRGRRLGTLAAAAAGRKRAAVADAALSLGNAGPVREAVGGAVVGGGSLGAGEAVVATDGSVLAGGAAGSSGAGVAGGSIPTASRVPMGAMGSRRRVLVAAGAFGAVGMLVVPLPAGAAAPAPCERAERYSAQSGSQILRVNALGSGDAKTASEVHIGDAKSAMVAQASVSSAAVARMIDAVDEDASGKPTEALQQQAPPTNKKPNQRDIGSVDVGPFSLGDGTVTTHARWEAGMACGATVGDVTRSTARLRNAGILADGDSALVRVPGKIESESTTRLERRGNAVATVASATLDSGAFELLDGAVKIKILKTPSLRTSMSIKDGGEVRYIPASLEVSGEGIDTARLDTAGDEVEITLDEPVEESGEAEHGRPGLLGETRLLEGGDGASLPRVPGVPEVAETEAGTAPLAGPGTKVRISLGDVRQAARGRAIAARAAALSVTITQGAPAARKPGYGSDGGVLTFDMGVLEAASVAPETAGGVSAGETAGEGGGLPITGPRVDVLALSGVALLIAGTGALIFGMRGRSRS